MLKYQYLTCWPNTIMSLLEADGGLSELVRGWYYIGIILVHFHVLSFLLSASVGQIVDVSIPQLQKGILVVFMRFQPERISERIVERIVRCSSSRRIEQFIAT